MEMNTFWYLAAIMVGGFLLDLILGDPWYPLHPIRLLGGALSMLEKVLRHLGFAGQGPKALAGGTFLGLKLFSLALGWYFFPRVILTIVLAPGPLLFILKALWDLYVVYSLLALGDLLKHGRNIAEAVEAGNLEQARHHTGMLVGRDLERMDGSDCARAGVESLSENLADGVIAPLFWLAIAGIPGLVIFKVASTMDSMVGYKNERYLYFGRFGARADDVLCYLPARLTALLIVFGAWLSPGLRAREAWKAAKEWHHVFPGFNSGWPEAAAAGALGIRLAGPIWKKGIQVNEAFVGPKENRETCSARELRHMMRLDLISGLAMVVLAVGILLLLGLFIA